MKALKRINILILVSIMYVAFSGCTPVQILHTQKVPEFVLSDYSTFDFFQLEMTDEIGFEFGERVEWLQKEIRLQMEARGLKQAEQEPDLLINIGMAFVEKMQTRETDLRTDAPRYAGSMNYGWQVERVEVGTYEEGTVVVHLVDSESKILVWESIAQSVVVEDDKKSRKNIAAGVKKMMVDL